MAGIDVEPDAVAGAHVGECVQVVQPGRAAVAGYADDHERCRAGGRVVEHPLHGRRVGREPGQRRHGDDRVPADPELKAASLCE